MPESQFGHAPTSLADTLNELVALARHLRSTPADVPKSLTRLEGLQQMLYYFCAPSTSPDTAEQWPTALTTHCAHANCGKTWRDFDACLLNFARADEPPIWLCRDHHPPLNDGGIRPPGWKPDTATRDALETTRRDTLRKLTRDELRVVNPRAGG